MATTLTLTLSTTSCPSDSPEILAKERNSDDHLQRSSLTKMQKSGDHPEWANIHPDVFSLIQDKLAEEIHHVPVDAVCKQWHSLTKDYNHLVTKSWRDKLLPPMLMIPTQSTEGMNVANVLYSVYEDKIRNVSVRLPSTFIDDRNVYYYYYCGCGNGWLAKVVRSYHWSILLMNPFKKAMGPVLPNLCCSILPSHSPKTAGKLKVILFAAGNPNLSGGKYLVMAFFTNCSSPIAFTTGVREKWSKRWISTKDCSDFNDATLYKGQIYAIKSAFGGIVSLKFQSICLNPESTNGYKVETRLRTETFNCSARGYLVESTNGDLLHVRRFLKRQESTGLLMTERFMVYKLMLNDAGRDDDRSFVQQIGVESIGDEALFLGDNQSVSVVASKFPGCRPNAIYYTADSSNILDHDVVESGDVGIFNLEDGTIIQLPPQISQAPSGAFWFSPSF